MEMFSADYFAALGSIILLDLVLGGDNAIIIGIAAHKLREKDKRKVMYYGILGALLLRGAMTVMAVGLLTIPFLQFVGGLLLFPVAIKLNNMGTGHEGENVAEGKTFWEAIKIVLLADVLMGVDNVLAVAGASKGDFSLIVIGLLVSIPILIWGSQFISKLLYKFKILVKFGAAVLAWTAGSMIVSDPIVGAYLNEKIQFMDVILPIFSTIVVLSIIYYREQKSEVI